MNMKMIKILKIIMKNGLPTVFLGDPPEPKSKNMARETCRVQP